MRNYSDFIAHLTRTATDIQYKKNEDKVSWRDMFTYRHCAVTNLPRMIAIHQKNILAGPVSHMYEILRRIPVSLIHTSAILTMFHHFPEIDEIFNDVTENETATINAVYAERGYNHGYAFNTYERLDDRGMPNRRISYSNSHLRVLRQIHNVGKGQRSYYSDCRLYNARPYRRWS